MKDFTPTDYILESVLSKNRFPDAGWTLDAPGEAAPTLIRAVYGERQLHAGPPEWGVFRYAAWLPVRCYLHGSAAPLTYRSEGLARHLGLNELYITFSGYWPEKGGGMLSCSFKETEAYAVCARLGPAEKGVLVVASAGNTARAFARVCSDNGVPLLLCVPADNLDALWFDKPLQDHVRMLCTPPGSDYCDAIHLAALACELPGFFPEGGAKNVARRDGMGTTVLSAAESLGRIPDLYFQAIGSGTGAIAAWEANLRLLADGRFGKGKMRLMVSQNVPFVPIYDAWKAASPTLLPLDDDVARRQVEEIGAKVLSNRRPPYALAGVLYEALCDTGGDVLLATNDEARAAAALFERTEGIDIHPAAAVATATLMREAAARRIPSDACIMLNITGGGEKLFKKEKQIHQLQPHGVLTEMPDLHDLERILRGWFD